MDELAFDHRHYYVSLRLFLTTQALEVPQYCGLFEMDVLTVSQRYDTIFDTHDLGHASSINPGGRSKKRSTTNTSTKRPNKLSMVELRNGVIECGGILEHSGAAISIRLPSRWQLKRRHPRQTPKKDTSQ